MQKSGLLQESAQRSRIVRAEFFAVANRQLEGSALQMAEQDFQIVRIDVGVFWRAVEKVIGMLHDVLIERRAGGHQHRSRRGLPTPGSARALPRGGDRA